MFKKLLMSLLIAITTFAYANPNKMFQTVDVKEATLLQTTKDKLYCPNCGMHLPKFYKTNHAVKLKDGTYRQYCSIYCLVEEMELTVLKGKHDTIKEILVVDVPSLKFIDAKKAYYVVGSSVKGTMTMTSKYAFEKVEDAITFMNTYGGEVKSFDEAYKIALLDFAKDTALVYDNRSTMMYKNGEKLYNTKCNKEAIDKIDAHTMGEMKAIIGQEKLCEDGLNDGQLQAIMLYIWDVKLNNFNKMYGENEEISIYIKSRKDADFLKRGENIHQRVCKKLDATSFKSFDEIKKGVEATCPKLKDEDKLSLIGYLNHVRSGNQMHKSTPIVVPSDAKCPVCGMFVAKYPKWAAHTKLKDGKEFFYDGTKDMFKFIFEAKSYSHNYTKDDFDIISVSDYYTLDKIDGKQAFYVLGSNVYGPMGKELIPFKTKEDAENFSKNYQGKQILKFEEITKDLVFALDK
ncbi:MAG: nitrous oxide reductase accessory protein NosL [Arcobacteraceae bacterium]|nr:nitrous oxide reductase accessory protein NosL [Arcobacteraceae bacterium]